MKYSTPQNSPAGSARPLVDHAIAASDSASIPFTTYMQLALYGNPGGYYTKPDTQITGRSGDFFATGFNIRARDVALHILPGYSEFPDIAARLGPHKRGKSCWYIKSLDVVDQTALRDLILAGLKDLADLYEIKPT